MVSPAATPLVSTSDHPCMLTGSDVAVEGSSGCVAATSGAAPLDVEMGEAAPTLEQRRAELARQLGLLQAEDAALQEEQRLRTLREALQSGDVGIKKEVKEERE
ncbi:hypothetical protein N7468_009495 [Penicillium chermesinum]|uniref:Uncharacterized protein n=1 Tax=Penicillium chermesinum TaxID=63820 RepID=A0A9W9NHV7_9EURO|nr:uncharacterized protein N7468_009495 [Penicillium chermesinum]KAJ5220291.1 hypothetical protein N7468_009495 [Penicillium chermesinum]